MESREEIQKWRKIERNEDDMEERWRREKSVGECGA
jgi:hypothetical protein